MFTYVTFVMVDIRNEFSKECDEHKMDFRQRRKRENKSEDRKPAVSERPGCDLGNVTNIFGS